MTTPWAFDEHADLGFADANAVADYILRSESRPRPTGGDSRAWGSGRKPGSWSSAAAPASSP